MKRCMAKYIALVSLVLLIVPSVMFLADRMELQTVKTIMLIATIIWLISATVWMWNNNTQPQEDQ